MQTKVVLSTILLIPLLGGIVACANGPAAASTPQPLASAATATTLPTPPTLAASPTVSVAPTATVTVVPTAAATPLADSIPAPTSSSATPASTPLAAPTPTYTATTFPTPTSPRASPTPAPASFDQLIAQLTSRPTPTVTRKGVANSNVDETEYMLALVSDLNQLSAAIDKWSSTLAAYDQDEASEAEVVAAFEETSSEVSALYHREVARDYPPRLKTVDGAYVEALRAADKMFTAFLNALKTGDKKYLDEASKQYKTFQYFVGEFQKRVKQYI